MKVGELISILERYDEDAEVILGIQPNYPFEHRIRSVIERREIDGYEEDEEDEEDVSGRDSFSTKGKLSDVIICEGGQIRYGSRSMFD